MIITTQRSPLALAIDAALTALGWAGFFYLFTQGVVNILAETYTGPDAPLLEPFVPTLTTLAAYLLVAAFNALVIVLWAHYHRIYSSEAMPATGLEYVDDQAVASHFHLSRNQLHEIQDSRVTVIYHSVDGDIAHLETDQLRVETAPALPAFGATKVA
ncbi:MAG TPA: poly-beta-1,6-N-acetyl-D-glucosamine biosynthesis protein PgaD [Candidimonas sp.]|nr:poly-beta-1,6-N-acetyl-D-glucosamine biosynthesis protein PgaD [Candidimonas sp.]